MALPAAVRSALYESLRAGAFRPVVPNPRPRIGAEAEFIPVRADTGETLPIDGDGMRTSLALLRHAGAGAGWREMLSPKGTPQFLLPDGGTLGFEPGGQLEYSSPPCATGSALLRRLEGVMDRLLQAAESMEVALLFCGIDPRTPVEQAPLQLAAERYGRMDAYLARIGPFGARMMRQTAAFQVSLDLADEPERLWRVLNAMAPYLAAIFANAPQYAGADTGHASYRAHCWRQLDPSRTGVRPPSADPVRDYLDFALAAPPILLPDDGAAPRPFAEQAARGCTDAEWRAHLTTLFPEIRPRGTYEVRTCDAIPPEWYAAPLALLGGIAYDPAALRQADELLEGYDPTLLERAGRAGLGDGTIAAVARDLVVLALDGCEALGAALLERGDLDTARAFFDRYTFAGRAPADDVRPVPAAAR